MSHQSNFNAAYPTNPLTAFEQTIGGALIHAADLIMGEIGSLTAVGNAKRHTLAQNIVAPNGVLTYIPIATAAYLENGGTTTDVDATVDTGIAAIWNDLADVAHGD